MADCGHAGGRIAGLCHEQRRRQWHGRIVLVGLQSAGRDCHPAPSSLRSGACCNRRRRRTGRAECRTHQPRQECKHLSRRRGGLQSFTHHSAQNQTQRAEQSTEQKPHCRRYQHSAVQSTSQSASHLQNHSASGSPTESPTELPSDSQIRSTSHSVTESPIRSWIQLPIQSLSHSTSDP